MLLSCHPRNKGDRDFECLSLLKRQSILFFSFLFFALRIQLHVKNSKDPRTTAINVFQNFFQNSFQNEKPMTRIKRYVHFSERTLLHVIASQLKTFFALRISHSNVLVSRERMKGENLEIWRKEKKSKKRKEKIKKKREGQKSSRYVS